MAAGKPETNTNSKKSICFECKKKVPSYVNYCPYCEIKLTRDKPTDSTNNKNEILKGVKDKSYKFEFSLFYGMINGKESPLIGWTSTGKEIKIKTGGQWDLRVGINYLFSPNIKLTTSYGYSVGFLNFKFDDVKGKFTKYPLRMGLLGMLRLGKFLGSINFIHIGPGVSVYFKPSLYHDWRNYNYRVTINYETAVGFDFKVGLTFVSTAVEWLFSFIDFRYHYVKYSMQDGLENDTKLTPANIKQQWRELDGSHYGIYIGFGFRL